MICFWVQAGTPLHARRQWSGRGHSLELAEEKEALFQNCAQLAQARAESVRSRYLAVLVWNCSKRRDADLKQRLLFSYFLARVTSNSHLVVFIARLDSFRPGFVVTPAREFSVRAGSVGNK